MPRRVSGHKSTYAVSDAISEKWPTRLFAGKVVSLRKSGPFEGKEWSVCLTHGRPSAEKYLKIESSTGGLYTRAEVLKKN
jgi:hypothetical protein